MNKCKYCINYKIDEDDCDKCPFEFDEGYFDIINGDDFDILNLDDNINWSHLQILDRLHSKGLPCSFADIWVDNNIVLLLGCNVFTYKIAEVLGVHEECVYNWSDQAMIIINTFQEKCIRRKELEEKE